MQYYSHPLATDDYLAGAALHFGLEPETESQACIRNFLFLIPESASELERGIVQVAARRMAEAGYVYMAVAGQKDMEDRDGIRFMPFRAEALPSFGLMTTVIVLHQMALAEQALGAYPDAQVFLLNPRIAAATQDEVPHSMLSCAGQCFSQLRPWLVTGQTSPVHAERSRPTVIAIPSAMGLGARLN